jgi:hypothetical protein
VFVLCREIIYAYCEKHTKDISTLCGKKSAVCLLKQVVHIVTTGLHRGDCNGIQGILNYCHEEMDVKTLADAFP